MSDQKNIDNLFRETFNDFEASPDPALWDKISDTLDAQESEKKRKGIVFLPWLYKGAGIAAALLLLFFVGNELMNTNENGNGSEEQTTSTTKKDSNLNENNNGTTSNSQLTDANSEENSSNDTNNSSSDNILKNQERIANEDNVDNNKVQQKNGNDDSVKQGNALQNSIAQQNGTNTNTASQESSSNSTNADTTKNSNLITNENAVANTNSSQDQNSTTNKTNQQTQSNRVNNENSKIGNGENAVAQHNKNGTKTSVNDVQNSVNLSETNSNSSAVAQNDKNNSTNTSNSSNSSVTDTTKTKDAETVNTETAVAEVKKATEIKKSLLDVINDLHDLEKDTEVAEVERKKWTISPNASPVYYNSITNGSPIDEAFADNTKVGDVNLSYGINVGYDVSKRLTVRSGIHKVDYSYSTQDIAIVPSINGNTLSTIAFRTNGASFEIKDRGTSSTILYSQYQLPTSESSINEKQIEGNLNQRMSYIEIPVELKYAVVDKKLGINVIGGISTLLLTGNSIVVDSPELYAELGEATNVNNVSFSTNIGFGIDYKISKQLEFNIEPMLKYQLNTFSGNTGNFKPYSVGVYTGVSFRF